MYLPYGVHNFLIFATIAVKRKCEMKEVYPGISCFNLVKHEEYSADSVITLYLIRTEKRSLLIDTGYVECRDDLIRVLDETGIPYENLDVFLTHHHSDHCGNARTLADRGAVMYMNPEEQRHQYDCISYRYSAGSVDAQRGVLRHVGVTEERTPDIWNIFMDINRRVEKKHDWYLAIAGFPFRPVHEGQIFEYGDFRLKAILLRGHTYGQMGLIDEEKKLLFPADQFINGIIPIVATTYPHEHLLYHYLNSIEEIRQKYSGWTMFPMHGKPITDAAKVCETIAGGYARKADWVYRVVEASDIPLTVKEVTEIAYGIHDIPSIHEEFVTFKMMLTKTFSILEYLTDMEVVTVEEKDGMFFYSNPAKHI